jgi:hypothetical protein
VPAQHGRQTARRACTRHLALQDVAERRIEPVPTAYKHIRYTVEAQDPSD